MIQSFNPCDECDYSFSKRNQESIMCNICELKNLLSGKEKVDNNFIIVVMYKCKWCEKIFRSKRHKCMYNPENKNCFSCRYCTGFDDFKGQYGEYERCEIAPYKEFICNLEETDDTGYTDFYELHNKKWISNCPYWEIREGYLGKKSYAKLFMGKNI